MATKILNFDPEGDGKIILGNRDTASPNGYTSLSLEITSAKGGKGVVQSISASGSNFGELHLNPYGGLVVIPSITAAPKDLPTAPLVIDPKSGRIYYKSS